MPLLPGTRLREYEVVQAIGSGGMGSVYRARDTKLGRQVAIKTLPEELSSDAERLARFEREAKVLASLNHPGIATLYGLEEDKGQLFLVMELVEGETLAERIARGPIPLQEALPVFVQVADGLEAAHEKGVIHRDLKPANIKVTPERKVKILDFGLAKTLPRDASVEASQSPTLTNRTLLGTIIGTASYMSPEQARGKAVDRRTDIWSFGCCLYEALTGRRAFEGETFGDVIGAVLRAEPDWSSVPAAARRFLQRCLSKDPRERTHDIADARLALEDASKEKIGASGPLSRLPGRGRMVGVALLSAMVTATVIWAVLTSLPSRNGVLRLSVTLPFDQRVVGSRYNPPLALSPDGTLLAYIAAREGKRSQIYLRPLSAFEAEAVQGTEGAESVFFSPDARWLGFTVQGALQKVPLVGGAPVELWNGFVYAGASWAADNTIVLTQVPRRLVLVPAGSGEVRTVTLDDPKLGDFQLWPQVLPGGDRVILTSATEAGPRIAAVSLATGEAHVLELGNQPVSAALYVPTGHLLYSQSGGLWIAPFEHESLRVSGFSVSVTDRLLTLSSILIGENAHFAASARGTLAFLPRSSSDPTVTLEWIDHQGRTVPLIETSDHPVYPRVSPDGKRVAVTFASPKGSHIFLVDAERGSRTRFTTEGQNMEPVWTPSGTRVAFASTRTGPWNLYWKAVDGTGEAELLLDRKHIQFPGSWSPDGNILAFYERTPETGLDIYVLPMGNDRVPVPVVVTSANEHSPVFSPDGRWLAYVSDETGREEIYLRPYPGPGRTWTISTEGGREATWSPDGGQIYYRRGTQMLAVTVEREPELKVGKPRVLFDRRYESEPAGGISYAVAPFGERFLMIGRNEASYPTEIRLVVQGRERIK